MESDNDNAYKDIFITIKLSSDINRILTESSVRSHRKKLQEARIRLEDHLTRFHSISEKGNASTGIENKNQEPLLEENK